METGSRLISDQNGFVSAGINLPMPKSDIELLHYTKTQLWLMASLFLVLLAGCASVPLDVPKSRTNVIAQNVNTEFGRLAAGWADLNGSQSGFFPFVYGMDALGARLEMADRAQKSIDLQYFLMKDDTAGAVVASALWRAAERGVRVRFLLDDVFTTAPDGALVRLNSHPNIEVRLFNPISRRGLHSLNFVGHFRRANRRMHNKSFTVDNAIAIVGGRNIADEYYQLKSDAVFADFDVLAFGPVVPQVSKSFDQYWNHALAVPIEQFLDNSTQAPGSIEDAVRDTSRQEEVYQDALNSDLVRKLANGEQSMFVGTGRVIADDPDKLQASVGIENMKLATELGQLLLEAKQEVVFVTPYYVPEKDGVEFAGQIINNGADVIVVTNSLASNNHIPVHSAYSGYRKAVMDIGVELYEVRANAGRQAQGDRGPEQLTLHTKLIVIDRRYLFVGSLNLDPRSIEINAEMGLLIDAPELAKLVSLGIAEDLPKTSYKVVKNDSGSLEWHGTIDGQPVVEDSEPLSSRWRRFKAWMLRILPDSQL